MKDLKLKIYQKDLKDNDVEYTILIYDDYRLEDGKVYKMKGRNGKLDDIGRIKDFPNGFDDIGYVQKYAPFHVSLELFRTGYRIEMFSFPLIT